MQLEQYSISYPKNRFKPQKVHPLHLGLLAQNPALFERRPNHTRRVIGNQLRSHQQINSAVLLRILRSSRLTTAGKRSRQNHQISPSGGRSSGPSLFGRSGDWRNQSIPISKNGLTVGRSGHNQLQLNESSVSRQHATIIRARKGIYIRDENSSLGTYLNGHRIVGPTKMKNGDVIKIGHYQIFEFRER